MLRIHLLLYGIQLWAGLACAWAGLDWRVGGFRPNQNDCFFVILVTHPNSYIETTDRCDFGDQRSVKVEVRTGAIMKNSGIL